MGTVLTRRFRCPGENWKSGSDGFRAETQWRSLHSEWSRTVNNPTHVERCEVYYQQSSMAVINIAPLPGAPSGNFMRYQPLRRSFGQPPSIAHLRPCGWHSDQGDRFITKRRAQKLESMRYQPTNPGSFPSSRFWPRIIADSSMSQAMQRRPRLARRGQRRPSRRRRVSSSSRRSGMTTAGWVRLYQTTSPGDLPATLSRDTMNRL